MTITQLIAEKLDTLPPDQQQEVLDFVEFLQSKVAAESKVAPNGSEPTKEISALMAAQK